MARFLHQLAAVAIFHVHGKEVKVELASPVPFRILTREAPELAGLATTVMSRGWYYFPERLEITSIFTIPIIKTITGHITSRFRAMLSRTSCTFIIPARYAQITAPLLSFRHRLLCSPDLMLGF